ncbi:SDR family NAD(P)-dependent oxidoreductase [Thermodesulfobacteriota bacterium]
MKLQGKVSIITGAADGMGKGTALLFAAEGAKVVVCDINATGGRAVVQEIKNAGGEATFLEVDVAKSTDAKRMIDTAVDNYGRLDILFNNAGVPGETWEDTTEERWQRVMDVNVTAIFLACKYAVPLMQKQGGGNILSTASVGGLKYVGRSPSYAVSKASVIMLTKALAKDFAKDQIRVNCICPGAIQTGLTDAFARFPKTEEEKKAAQERRLRSIPLGCVGQPKNIADAALFLVSDEAAFITGHALVVDGGAL